MAKITHSSLADDFSSPIVKQFDKILVKTKELNGELKKTKKAFDSTKTMKSAKDLEAFGKNVDKVNEIEKERIKVAKEFEKLQAKTIVGISKQAKENTKLKISIAEQNKVTKQQAKEALGLVGAYERESKLLIDLKKRFKDLSVAGRANGKVAKGLLKDITKLDKKLKDVDKSVGENTRSIGGYTDSIKNAAGASGLFGAILGPLAAIQGTLSALTKKNTLENEANAVAKTANTAATGKLTIAQRALAFATGAGSKALKIFKFALASTGIGLLVIAVGALVAFFTRAQSGVDSLSIAFSGLKTALDVIIDRFSIVGEGIADIFSGNIVEGLDKIKNAFKGIGDELEREIELSTQLKRLTIELTREETLFQAQQAAGLTRAKELNLISRDKLKADLVRIDALKEANKIEVALAERQEELAARALAASLDSLSLDKKKLELLPEQLDFINRIKDGTIEAAEAVKLAADFTLSSAAGEEALEEIVQKVVEQEQAKQALLDKQATTIKKLSALQQLIANKESTRLARQAQALRELAKDENKAIEERIELLREAAVLEILSFKARSDFNIISEGETAAARIQINAKTEAAIQRLLKKTGDVRKEASGIDANTAQAIDTELKRGEIAAAQRQKNLEEEFRLRRQVFVDEAFFRRNLESATAEQIELINAKLTNDLADLANERVDREEAANQKIIDNEKTTNEERKAEAVALFNEITDVTFDALKAQSDARLDQLDSEISRREASIQNLRQKSEGEITEGIAFEEAQLEKARLKKQQEEEKAAKSARLRAIAQTFLNHLANSEEEGAAAIAKALAVALGGAVIAETIIGAAYEGVDDTGGRGNADARGGSHWILHEHEQVDSLADRKKKADPRTGKLRTRKEITDIVQEYDAGNTYGFMPQMAALQESQPIARAESQTKAIIQSNKEVIQAMKDNKTSFHLEANSFSEQMFIVTQKIKTGKSTETINHVYEPFKKIG